MTKTNAMRMLDRAKIKYDVLQYDYDESDLSGVHAAAALSLDPNQVFKTLVTRGGKNGLFVFCIPVGVKELPGLTGYLRGGCSPIGMKKQYPTFIDSTASDFEKIYVSAGQRGLQLCLDPKELAAFVGAKLCDVTA